MAGGKILFGLTAIKGVGRGAAQEIARCRQEKGPYADLFDFCERVDLKIISRQALERLIKAGAFDCFGARRAQLMQVLPGALQAAGELQQDRRHGQRNFFDVLGGGSDAPPQAAALPDIPEWSNSEKLKNEKEALDFYLSSHPLAHHEEGLRRFATHTLDQIAALGQGQEVLVGGMLTQVRFQNTKKGSRYARCDLEDLTGTVKCVMWPDDFTRYKDEIHEDRICLVKATVERTREEPGLILNRILDLDQAQKELTKGLVLSLAAGIHGPTEVEAIARVLQRSPGPCPVYLAIRDAAGKRLQLRLGEEFRINPEKVSTGDLETILGPNRVMFTGPTNGRNGK